MHGTYSVIVSVREEKANELCVQQIETQFLEERSFQEWCFALLLGPLMRNERREKGKYIVIVVYIHMRHNFFSLQISIPVFGFFHFVK